MGAEFEVVRSGVVAAPAAEVYQQINDFKNWDNWSPWADVDPEMRRNYAGAAAGVGAEYGWDGNRKAGAGHMKITVADPEKHIGLDIEFTRPMKASNRIEFDLAEVSEGTKVTWRMTGVNGWFMRLLGPIFNMDKLVGKDFEKGLRQLATHFAKPVA